MEDRRTYIVKTESPDCWYEVSNYNTASLKPGITIAFVTKEFDICELISMSRETAAEIVNIISSMLIEEQE